MTDVQNKGLYLLEDPVRKTILIELREAFIKIDPLWDGTEIEDRVEKSITLEGKDFHLVYGYRAEAQYVSLRSLRRNLPMSDWAEIWALLPPP